MRIINHEPRHAHVEPLLKQMNCLQLEDLYKQRVLASLYKVREEQVPELLLGYCKWMPENSRRWFQIQLPVKRTQMDRMLPQEKQATVWNNFFQDQELELLRYPVSSKAFNKNVKNHIIGTYYDECELKFCYSCNERLTAIEEKRAAALKKEQAKQAEIARLERKNDEEEYWYLLEAEKTR